MRDTTGEVGTSTLVMYSCGPLHMDEQKQDDQPEPTYNSPVSIRDVNPKTCQKQWRIGQGGEGGSVISVVTARHDDDDDENYSFYVFR